MDIPLSQNILKQISPYADETFTVCIVHEKNQQTEFWSIILMSELMWSYYEKFVGEKTLTKRSNKLPWVGVIH